MKDCSKLSSLGIIDGMKDCCSGTTKSLNRFEEHEKVELEKDLYEDQGEIAMEKRL